MRHSVIACAVLLGPLPAFAAEPNSASASSEPLDRLAPASEAAAPAESAADAGLLLPALIAPQIYAGSAYASARSGYDGANAAFVARATAEGSLMDMLALRVEFEHGPVSGGPEDRVRVGARLALLRQDEHGVDGGVALFYDPKDFREEGNVVGAVLIGRRFGRLGLFANALFGSDPEGDDQQLEVRLASSYRATNRLHVGLDTRARYNASSDAKRTGTTTTDWELQALPTLSVEVGHVALLADLGVSALQTTGPFGQPGERTAVDVGVLVLGGAAGAF